MRAAILAVDGGNSKTDVALVARTGEVLSHVRGPTVSHQVLGGPAGGERLALLVLDARRQAGLPLDAPATLGVYCLAGADFPSDVRLIRRELARHRLATDEVVLNDCFAALRAGATKGWGIVLICGQGINAAGVAPDGRSARFAGIGTLSGDWGGGGGLGQAALAAAIRARDGRGPRTALERSVAEHFGRRTPEAVMLAMYEGRLSSARLNELSPQVFAQAGAGDQVARALIDRLADELAAMAVALSRRLHITREEVEIVLAGGVFAATDAPFYARIEAGILKVARRARLVRPQVPPVAGSALLGLDRLAADGRASRTTAARLVASFARRGRR